MSLGITSSDTGGGTMTNNNEKRTAWTQSLLAGVAAIAMAAALTATSPEEAQSA